MNVPTGVHILTLGCSRNEVDSEELAGRLEAGGFRLVEDPAEVDPALYAIGPLLVLGLAAQRSHTEI